MNQKILICINNKLGEDVYKYLKKNKNFDVKLVSTYKIKKYQYCKNKKKFENFLKKLKDNFDLIITVYWPWIIKKKFLIKFNNSINFHPSLLPHGRGWYPHVYSAIYKKPYGVTLHKINSEIDRGDIWCQKKINISDLITGDELYFLAQKEIFKLFKANFHKILNNKIKPKKQSKKIKYLEKNWTNNIDELDLNKKYKALDLLNLIRIRTFKKNHYLTISHSNHKRKKLGLIIK